MKREMSFHEFLYHVLSGNKSGILQCDKRLTLLDLAVQYVIGTTYEVGDTIITDEVAMLVEGLENEYNIKIFQRDEEGED